MLQLVKAREFIDMHSYTNTYIYIHGYIHTWIHTYMDTYIHMVQLVK